MATGQMTGDDSRKGGTVEIVERACRLVDTLYILKNRADKRRFAPGWVSRRRRAQPFLVRKLFPSFGGAKLPFRHGQGQSEESTLKVDVMHFYYFGVQLLFKKYR